MDPKIIKVLVAYDIGETVYVTSDDEQRRWIIVSYKVFEHELSYELFSPGRSYSASQFELSRDKTID